MASGDGLHRDGGVGGGEGEGERESDEEKPQVVCVGEVRFLRCTTTSEKAISTPSYLIVGCTRCVMHLDLRSAC